MKEKDKLKLMKKYKIKNVGGGIYGEGFFDCLKYIDDVILKKWKKEVENGED